jgi:hypothetical protein
VVTIYGTEFHLLTSQESTIQRTFSRTRHRRGYLMRRYDGDLDEFVQENQEILVKIIKHSDDEFVRGLALSALIEYGPALNPTSRNFQW